MQLLNRQNTLTRALAMSGMIIAASGFSSIAFAAKDQGTDTLSNAQLTQMVKELSTQNKSLLEKLNQIEAKQSQQETQVQQQSAQVQQQAQQVQQQAQAVEKVQQDIKDTVLQKPSNDESSTTVSGYGE
ncbi:MAG: hypothetical protein KGM99_19775, partial [Burkholderiales bacterium]|nr:hypothetical protein [Burkholderiales bacterium]